MNPTPKEVPLKTLYQSLAPDQKQDIDTKLAALQTQILQMNPDGISALLQKIGYATSLENQTPLEKLFSKLSESQKGDILRQIENLKTQITSLSPDQILRLLSRLEDKKKPKPIITTTSRYQPPPQYPIPPIREELPDLRFSQDIEIPTLTTGTQIIKKEEKSYPLSLVSRPRRFSQFSPPIRQDLGKPRFEPEIAPYKSTGTALVHVPKIQKNEPTPTPELPAMEQPTSPVQVSQLSRMGRFRRAQPNGKSGAVLRGLDIAGTIKVAAPKKEMFASIETAFSSLPKNGQNEVLVDTSGAVGLFSVITKNRTGNPAVFAKQKIQSKIADLKSLNDPQEVSSSLKDCVSNLNQELSANGSVINTAIGVLVGNGKDKKLCLVNAGNIWIIKRTPNFGIDDITHGHDLLGIYFVTSSEKSFSKTKYDFLRKELEQATDKDRLSEQAKGIFELYKKPEFSYPSIVEAKIIDVDAGDEIVFLSPSLTRNLTAEEIKETIRRAKNPQQASDELTQKAYALSQTYSLRSTQGQNTTLAFLIK